MPTAEIQKSIVFSTEDGLVTFLFTIGKDPLSPRQDPLVTADIELFWEGASPLEPITAELRPGQPAQLAHVSDNGYTLDGTLSLQSMSNGRLAILADIFYGQHDDHHLAGVLGIFSLAIG
jgi:hypothetical protein